MSKCCVRTKLSKKLGAMKRMTRLPTKVLDEIYYKTVIPTITYNMAVWGNCSTALLNNLETIHTRAAPIIHHLPSSLQDEECLNRANWHPLSYIYIKEDC
jgi:hypothetical protein